VTVVVESIAALGDVESCLVMVVDWMVGVINEIEDWLEL
jgi:hypothetical protein